MKIRSGFVTNSSSTSFLIIAKEELDREKFFDLMGIAPDSPISDLFDAFYGAVIRGVSFQASLDDLGDLDDPEISFGRHAALSDYMLTKIKEARESGGQILYGTLSSEEDTFEAFFCTDSFEAENEHFYFNGLNCVW